MAASGTPQLHVQLLGPPCWRKAHGGQGELKKKQALLVAYVAVHGAASGVQRDTVAEKLWGRSAGAPRIGALHQALYTLRRQVGHAFIEQRLLLRLLPDVRCDLADDLAGWTTAALLQRCEFLEGVAAPPNLASWLTEQREHWLARVCQLLLQRDQELQSANALPQALRVACRLTELAPKHETGWRARMWLHFMAGDLGAAADAHEMLLAGLPPGRGPSAESQSLWRVVQAGARAPGLLTGDNASLRWPPQLLGRTAQWAAMSDAAARGQPFFLRGESGVGLSRLLASFFAKQGPSIIVKALGGDREAPYTTLASLLRELDDQYGLKPGAADRRTLSAVVPQWRNDTSAVVTDGKRIEHALHGLVQRAVDEGVRCIGIDDLHQADAASLALFRRLAQGPAARQLRLGFAARLPLAQPLHEFLEDWRCGAPPLHAIDVPPWTATEVAELLPTLALSGPAATVTAQALHSHAGGNPFMLLQTLRELSATWVPGQPLPQTDSASAAMQRRLHGLPSRALPLLHLAAVLGPDIAHAARLLGRPAREFETWRADLQAHHVFSEGRFVHDSMREVALAALSAAERLHWHAVAADALEHDLRVPPIRVAAHWAAAEQWPQAGAAFHAAARLADDAGRAAEARGLFAQAVACLRRAGAASEEFDAVFDSLPAELLLDDVRTAQALLERLGELAATPEQQARTALAAAQFAVSHYARGDAALAATAHAVRLTQDFPHLHGDALGLHAAALAQAGQLQASLTASEQALAMAGLALAPRKAREIATHRVYVCWEVSRITEAVRLCRGLVDDYEGAGDDAGAAAMEGHLAVLLLSVDAAAALQPALSACERHRAIDASASGPMAVMHRVALANAHIYRGRFDLAQAALHEEGRPIGEGMLPGILAKVQLLLAHTHLLLGDDASAVSALDKDDSKWPPAMQIQRCWALARAARMRGRSGVGHLERIGKIHSLQTQFALAHTAWLEWSRQGDAREVADHMHSVQQQYEQAGMLGTARAAALRRIDRLGELADANSTSTASGLARDLFEQLSAGAGLHASVYPPEAWLTLAHALRHAGHAGHAAEAAVALSKGRAWIERQVLSWLPAPQQERFRQRNPVNRVLLAEPPRGD